MVQCQDSLWFKKVRSKSWQSEAASLLCNMEGISSSTVRRRRGGPAKSPSISQKTPEGGSSLVSARSSTPSVSASSMKSPSQISFYTASEQGSPVRLDKTDEHENIPTLGLSRSTGGSSPHRGSFFETGLDPAHGVIQERNNKWIAYHDDVTGFPVYYNTYTESKTWNKPQNAEITWTQPATYGNVPDYDPENLGHDYLDHPFIEPSIDRAKNFQMRQIAHHGKAHFLSAIHDIHDISQGEQGYLFYLRSLAILFWVLSILVSPLILTNVSGSRIPEKDVDLWGIVRTFAPNAGDQNTSSCSGASPLQIDCEHEMEQLKMPSFSFMQPAPMTMLEYANLVAAIDLIVMGLFAMTMMTVYCDLHRHAEENKRMKVKASDYCVKVLGLPPDAIETEIIDHFSDLYNLQHVDWRGRRIPQPMLYPVGHYGNSCDIAYYEKWVAEVSIANPIGTNIRRLQERVGLVTELRVARARAKVYSMTPYSKQYETADVSVFRIENKISHTFAKHEKVHHNFRHKDDVVCAFVLFNNIESAARCVEDYAPYDSVGGDFFQPAELRFMGEYPLQVEWAPEPSDVLWENLEVSDHQVMARRCVSYLATLAVLMLSLVGLVMIDNFGELYFSAEQAGTVIGVFIDFFGEILEFVIVYFVNLEHAHSLSDVVTSLSNRLYVVRGINTAAIPIASSYKWFVFENSTYEFWSGENRYNGFPAQWYTDTGEGIVVALMIGPLMTYGLMLLWEMIASCKRSCKRVCGIKHYTQKQINELYTTPEFDLGSEVGNVTMQLACTFAFSSTMPILIPIAAITFTVVYLIEKYLILRYYKKSPKMSSAVVIASLRSCATILTLHMFTTVWMLGEFSVIWSPSANSRLYKVFLNDTQGLQVRATANRMLDCASRDHIFYHLIALPLCLVLTIFVNMPRIRLCHAPCCVHKSVHHGKKPPYTYFFSQTAYPHHVGKMQSCMSHVLKCFRASEVQPDGDHAYFSEEEIQEGWYTQQEGAFRIKKKCYTKAGMDDEGTEHKGGDAKRTWEVIRDDDLYTYNLAKNPRYTELFKGKMIQQTLKVRSNIGAVDVSTPRRMNHNI
jgi:hypothetical protein